MKILQDLIDAHVIDIEVKDVYVGMHWTAVISRYCGLASSLREPPPHADFTVVNAGQLNEMNAVELSAMVLSDKIAEASIGLAAINSQIEIDESKCEPVNGFEIIADKGYGKTIGVIGHFPYVEKLRKLAKQVYVFEKILQAGDLPVSEMKSKLPECEIVAISGTTLINHTLEEILANCNKSALKIMLGASTPMSEVLFDYGLDYLAGSKVENVDQVITAIVQGATFRQLKGIKRLTMAAKR